MKCGYGIAKGAPINIKEGSCKYDDSKDKTCDSHYVANKSDVTVDNKESPFDQCCLCKPGEKCPLCDDENKCTDKEKDQFVGEAACFAKPQPKPEPPVPAPPPKRSLWWLWLLLILLLIVGALYGWTRFRRPTVNVSKGY